MAVLPPDLMPELLARSSRPGAVEVGHVRRLTSRYRDAFAPSPLLQRLLARRGENDTTIASGALLLALPPLPLVADDEDHPTQPLPMAVAMASRSEASADQRALPLAVALSPAAEADAPIRPAANTAVDGRSSRAAPADSPIATPARDRAGSLPDRPVLAQDRPRAVARPLAAVDIAGGAVLKRAPGRAAAAIESPAGSDDAPMPVTERVAALASQPLPLASSHEAPQPRELPGPAIAADLLLPPNPLPQTTQRLRRARAGVVEVDGQPVESASLPLMVAVAMAASSVPVPPTAANAALFSSAAVSPARPAATPTPQRSPAAIEPQAAGWPFGVAPADPQQLADQVGRELTRSLRRARERKGMPPWTS